LALAIIRHSSRTCTIICGGDAGFVVRERQQDMGIFKTILCKAGKHDRSRGRARWIGGAWVSYCRQCDAPLTRLPDGRWAVITPESAEADIEVRGSVVGAAITAD
jgi:hypothetical protein